MVHCRTKPRNGRNYTLALGYSMLSGQLVCRLEASNLNNVFGSTKTSSIVEVADGLNRTKRIMPSGVTEDMYDTNGDGV